MEQNNLYTDTPKLKTINTFRTEFHNPSTVGLLGEANQSQFSSLESRENLSSLEFYTNLNTLKLARGTYYPKILDSGELTKDILKEIVEAYKKWVNEPLYLCFTNEEGEYEFHLASKRGNKVYRYKLFKRIDELFKTLDTPEFKKLLLRKEGRKWYSNILFVTLTWNPKKTSRHMAWRIVSKKYNRFITAFRQRYGKVWAMRSFEAFKKDEESPAYGYPHIHILMICEHAFEAEQDKKGVWRIKIKKRFVDGYQPLEKMKLWFSYFDIKIPVSLQKMKDYLTKDMFKQYLHKWKTDKDLLSLSLGWFFRHRAIAISGEQLLTDLKNALSITQISGIYQIKEILQNNKKLTFIGLVCIDFGGDPPPNFIKKKLNPEEEVTFELNVFIPRRKIDDEDYEIRFSRYVG